MPNKNASQHETADYEALYRMLRRKLIKAGCLRRTPWHHIRDGLLVICLYSCGYYVLLADPEWEIRLLALGLLAFSNVQAGYITHEAVHGAITSKRRVAVFIGQFFNTFLTALCYSHFQDIHRRHHPHCNETRVDPDMQGGGIFSLYQESAFLKRGLGKIITRFQSILIWPLVSLQGFTLKIDSVKLLLRRPKETVVDQLTLLAHAVLWIGPPSLAIGLSDAVVNYALMTWFVGPYVGMIFLLNHTGMRTIGPDEKPPILRHQLMTTRNLGKSRFTDFIFGGLNNHIEHHLFPAIPTARLRRARRITRDFCKRNELPYHETTWFGGAAEVAKHLDQVSMRAAKSASTR
jgi:fatty acid desaturase